MVVIRVSLGAVAEEVEVDSPPPAGVGVDPLEHDDAVLHRRGRLGVSNFRRQVDGGEVDQDEKLSWLEIIPLQLVLMTLRFFVSSWRRQRCSSICSSTRSA